MGYSLDTDIDGENSFDPSIVSLERSEDQQMDDADLSFLTELLQQNGGLPASPLPQHSAPTTPTIRAATPSSSDDGRSAEHSSDDLSGSDVSQKRKPADASIVQADDREKKRRSLSAKNARLYRSRKKGRLVDLREQVSVLQRHLDGLRSRHAAMHTDIAAAHWEEVAIAQRLRRRQAEAMNDQLQQALLVQTGIVRDLRSIFTESAPPSPALNMRHYLHSHTHLRKDPASRKRDLEAIGTDAKLDRGMQVVLRETATILPTLSPDILFQELDLGTEGLGKTSTAVYAFNTRDAEKAFNVTCNAIFSCNGVWPDYTRVESSMQMVDVPPTKHSVRYGITKHTYRHNSSKKQITSEARDLYYSRMSGSCGVLVWDYVDADDLYPLRGGTYIKRNTIGALVIRPEVCHDGKVRIVCRSICTDMQMLVNLSSLQLKVAEFALLEDMMLFNMIKDGVTDWHEEVAAV